MKEFVRLLLLVVLVVIAAAVVMACGAGGAVAIVGTRGDGVGDGFRLLYAIVFGAVAGSVGLILLIRQWNMSDAPGDARDRVPFAAFIVGVVVVLYIVVQFVLGLFGT